MKTCGIQQDNHESLREYIYNTEKGKVIWKHFNKENGNVDVGHGCIGDFDPEYRDIEIVSFS
ncbi:hypothetical protein TRFO_04818 [Tritrichomonas foetus]|uniref:Uncharacterized protein n=1 Tax=Tritrichomonas foetus TaxID=1144522 RepID=A0A1J4KHA8_9EUKA|nr:hypothetical protein TRFO_04818 [Tritrichomonas foetus]|eukprot:OHT08725.1 hypothetical protein TRFO_04818 [Tritrichomonas foetus]